MDIQIQRINCSFTLVFCATLGGRGLIVFFFIFQWCSLNKQTSRLSIRDKFPDVIDVQGIFESCVELERYFGVTFEKERYNSTKIICETLHINHSSFWSGRGARCSIRSRLHDEQTNTITLSAIEDIRSVFITGKLTYFIFHVDRDHVIYEKLYSGVGQETTNFCSASQRKTQFDWTKKMKFPRKRKEVGNEICCAQILLLIRQINS